MKKVKFERWDGVQRFRVGQRVRVRIDVVPKEIMNCDVGVITEIRTRFLGHALQDIRYCVRFDDWYIKPGKEWVSNFRKINAQEKDITALPTEGER